MAVLLPRLLQSRSPANPRNSLDSYLDLDASSRATSPISDASTPTNSYFFFVPDGMRLGHRSGPSYDASAGDDLPRGSSRITSDNFVMVVPPNHPRSISPRIRQADEHSHLRFPSEATERTTWASAGKPLPDAPPHQAPPRLNLTFSALSFGSFRIRSPTEGLEESTALGQYPQSFANTTEERHASATTHASHRRTVTSGTTSFLDFDKDVDSSDAGTARHQSGVGASDVPQSAEAEQGGGRQLADSQPSRPLADSSFLFSGQPTNSPVLNSILLVQGNQHVDSPPFAIMPTALPTFLSLGAENLGKGKSGSVAEAPSASAYYGDRQDVISPTKSLWNSMRGKRAKQVTQPDGYAPLDRYQSPTRSQASLPVSHGFYGVDTTFTPAGKINLGYAFPSPSANGSQQTLRQQKSFLNLSNVQPLPNRDGAVPFPYSGGSRPSDSLDGSPRSVDSAGQLVSHDYAQPRGVPNSASAPHGLSDYLAESRLRPSESTPDLRMRGLEGVTRRPSAATTDDAKLRRPAPPVPQQSVRLAPPAAVRQTSRRQPKPPPSAGPTTSSQIHPIASRWRSATACDQFVLPRPRLVAHAISPPGSPEKEEKVVLISRDAETRAPVPGEAIIPPSNPLQAAEQREVEREQWAAYSKGKRSLSFSTVPALTRGTITSTPKTSLESKPRSRASSFSQLFRRASSSEDRPGRARTSSFSSTNAKSFGFLNGSQREDPAQRAKPEDSKPLFKAPARQRERAPNHEQWQANLGYPRMATGLPTSMSSPNLVHTGALMEKQDDEAVVIIGRPTLTPTPHVRTASHSSNKALPALPSHNTITRRDAPATLDLTQTSSSSGSADASPLPVTGFVSPSRVDDQELARRELERAHQRQIAQRAFLPAQVRRPVQAAAESPKINRKASNEILSFRDKAPEPLPLATAMALASRSASSPRRKKSAIEEAVSRARTNDARSPLSPAFSAPSVYSHRRQHSDAGSDHTSILEAAGIVSSPTAPEFTPGHRSSVSQPPLLGPPILSPAMASPAPRQLEYLKQNARQAGGSPMSQASSHGSPMPNPMLDEPERFQDLFFSQPSREWGSPMQVSSMDRDDGKGHIRSSSAPFTRGHLSGLGFDAASSEDHGERFEIQVATPIDDDALHEVVDPGPANLSGSLDPRRVLEQGDEQTETLGRQLSALFSEESPELSGRSDGADSSPEREVDRQLDWRNTLLRSESDTPIRVGNVSSGNLDPPSAYFARHVKGRQSTSSVIPELGTQPSTESLSRHVRDLADKHASGTTDDDPSRYSFVGRFPSPPDSPRRSMPVKRSPPRADEDFRNMNLHALAMNSEAGDEDDEDDGAEHLRSPTRPSNARTETETTVAESFHTATEGYGASESGHA